MFLIPLGACFFSRDSRWEVHSVLPSVLLLIFTFFWICNNSFVFNGHIISYCNGHSVLWRSVQISIANLNSNLKKASSFTKPKFCLPTQGWGSIWT